jgi:transposase
VESSSQALHSISPTSRGKTANVVNVAIAREMVGFIWSIACTIQSMPKTA